MDELERSIGDLVIANRILATENVVDAYGHVSIRHPQKPDRYLLSRSLSPEFVTRDDIIEFKLDGEPVGDTRPPYLERFIHGAIYEARPEINAVIHSHAEDILPFSISKTPMCCVAHVASDMGTHVPVWDIADKFGDETNLLVINMAQGRDMARILGKNSVVLMRGHGFSAAAEGLLKLVRLSVYLRAKFAPATTSAPAPPKCNAAGNSGRGGPAAATCSRAARAGSERWRMRGGSTFTFM
jgi:ribulose-5-phosphate 4-epimerase/fuculose-1-phosphate aldolase